MACPHCPHCARQRAALADPATVRALYAAHDAADPDAGTPPLDDDPAQLYVDPDDDAQLYVDPVDPADPTATR